MTGGIGIATAEVCHFGSVATRGNPGLDEGAQLAVVQRSPLARLATVEVQALPVIPHPPAAPAVPPPTRSCPASLTHRPELAQAQQPVIKFGVLYLSFPSFPHKKSHFLLRRAGNEAYFRVWGKNRRFTPNTPNTPSGAASVSRATKTSCAVFTVGPSSPRTDGFHGSLQRCDVTSHWNNPCAAHRLLCSQPPQTKTFQCVTSPLRKSMSTHSVTSGAISG